MGDGQIGRQFNSLSKLSFRFLWPVVEEIGVTQKSVRKGRSGFLPDNGQSLVQCRIAASAQLNGRGEVELRRIEFRIEPYGFVIRLDGLDVVQPAHQRGAEIVVRLR